MVAITAKDELVKRYMYLYKNKKLILALCIGRGVEKKSIVSRIERTRNLIQKNSICQENEEISRLLKNLIKEYEQEIYDEKYYLMANVEDSIVSMFEEFLFSDSEMEELALYKHIEAVKKDKNYLDAFGYAIELLEERRQKNIQLKKLPTFTVWKILSYVRRKNLNNLTALKALDRYYNLERYMITGDNYKSGYLLSDYDSETLGEESLKKYPNDIIISDGLILFPYENCFEIEDYYFAEPSIIADSEEPYDQEAPTTFMLKLSTMPNLDIETKNNMRKKLTNDKTLVKTD